MIPSADVDLISGKQEIDEEEEEYERMMAAKGPQTRWERLWDAL